MDRDRDARARPARLDPDAPARRRSRQSRTETTALPVAARRRPTRVPRPPHEAAPATHVAVVPRARCRVHQAQRAPRRHRLTLQPAEHPPATDIGRTPRSRCPNHTRLGRTLPRKRPAKRSTPPTSRPHLTPHPQPLTRRHLGTPTARSGLGDMVPSEPYRATPSTPRSGLRRPAASSPGP